MGPIAPMSVGGGSDLAAGLGVSGIADGEADEGLETPQNNRTVALADSSFDGPLVFPPQAGAAAPSQTLSPLSVKPPAVGSSVPCYSAFGKGTVTNVTSATDQSYATNARGQEYLPDYQISLACESKSVVGSPYGFIRDTTWNETVTVGVDADHALSGNRAEAGGGISFAEPVSDVEASDPKVVDTGATRAKLTNAAQKGVDLGMKAAVTVAVPYGALAVGAINAPADIDNAIHPDGSGQVQVTPTTDPFFQKASEFVVDHLFGGAAIRSERLRANLANETRSTITPAPPAPAASLDVQP